MGTRRIFQSVLLASCLGVVAGAAGGEPFTINGPLRMAVQTNPTVGEAAANRRATEAELHQTQGTLLPQVRLEAQGGPTRLNVTDPIYTTPPNSPPLGNGTWLPASKGSIVLRQ